jgi:hypothetical protein
MKNTSFSRTLPKPLATLTARSAFGTTSAARGTRCQQNGHSQQNESFHRFTKTPNAGNAN